MRKPIPNSRSDQEKAFDMRTIVQALWAAGLSSIMVCIALQAHAQDSAPTAEELAAEIQAIKQEYEARIRALEGQLEAMTTTPAQPAQPAVSPMGRKAFTTDNVFNPAIGMVLDPRYSTQSEAFAPAGFQVGHGAERPVEGFSLGHPEFTLTGNVDDKFFGAATIALEVPPGESVELEVEEFYIQTLPGAGLPDGARIKAGRALWTFGYLNEIHLHADDFSDRPIPYRAFLDHSFNDDGLELSYVLPTDIYAEVGGGLFRGDDVPFAGSANGRNAWSVFGRMGGDFGRNGAWRIGAYMMAGEAHNRAGGHDHAHGGEEDEHGHEGEHAHEDEHGHEDEHAHEDEHGHEDEHADEDHNGEMHDDDHDDHAEDEGLAAWANIDAFTDGEFSGDATMYAVDARVTWAPTGNPREQEVILQGEVFWRVEDGYYSLPGEYDTPTFTDSTAMGFYVQGIYKLNRNFRIGARYARLTPPDIPECVLHDGHCDAVTPALDDSVGYAVMADWTNSEFSRIRLQYNREEVQNFVHGRLDAHGEDAPVFVEQDDQILLQYIMSLGAHAAHTF